jgi:hypothetical protein
MITLRASIINVNFFKGNDQTAVELLNIDDQDLVRDEILNLLGLSRAPKKNLQPNSKGQDLKSKENQTVSSFFLRVTFKLVY